MTEQEFAAKYKLRKLQQFVKTQQLESTQFQRLSSNNSYLQRVDMDRRYIERKRAFKPVRRQQPQQPPNELPEGVSDSLQFTCQQIQSPKDENESLEEKITLLEDRQVLPQVKEKGGRERLVKIKAHNLCRLNEVNQKLQRTEEQWKTQCEDLKANLMQKDNKIQALEEEIALLENRQMDVNQLKEEVREKDCLLQREVRERSLRARAQLQTLSLLCGVKRKLQRTEEQWKSRRDGLESDLIEKDDQPQTLTTGQDQLVTKEKEGKTRRRRRRQRARKGQE